eukprot:evm.model.scf_1859EXC.4 EVM.evm.TU.scf_1859EXC.4   scf_1859EXC:16474-17451(+)
MGLTEKVWEAYRSHACTNASDLTMEIGDVWAGGHNRMRVMGLTELKEELVRVGIPRDRVEEAFMVEVTPYTDVALDFAGQMVAQPTVVESVVGEGPAVQISFGSCRKENYIFSAVPAELHRFRVLSKAERMFKFAVAKCKRRRNDRLFRREWFLVEEVVMSSSLVFVRVRGAGRLLVSGQVDGGRNPGVDVLREMLGLRLSRVGAALRFGGDSVDLHKLVNGSRGACLVKVKNNRPLVSSRNINQPGLLRTGRTDMASGSQAEKIAEGHLQDEAERLEWGAEGAEEKVDELVGELEEMGETCELFLDEDGDEEEEEEEEEDDDDD